MSGDACDRDNVAPAGRDDLSPVAEADRELLLTTAREALAYFLDPISFANGLVRDSARPDSPCSVAAVGFGAASLVCGVDLGLIDREDARQRVARVVRAVLELPMADEVSKSHHAAGYRGWFYHFLHADGPKRGQRRWQSELSSIDSALMFAGLAFAADYFGEPIAQDVNTILSRIDWSFMLRPGGLLSHGWRPEAIGGRRKGHGNDGFIRSDWTGYNEALLLVLLALGDERVSAEVFSAWFDTAKQSWQSPEGIEHLHCPPLFVHQFPHAFFDFRGVGNDWLGERGLDLFENSRRATLAQIAYACRNPHGFAGYSETTWGLSSSNGPGNAHAKRVKLGGRSLRFHAYAERGVPPPGGAIDDGTLAPWAVAASVPFLPDECLAGIRGHRAVTLCRPDWTGFMGSYNLTYQGDDCPHGWVDEHDLGIEQGPIVMMIANHLNDTMWRTTRESPRFRVGMQRANLKGGWLG